ncbi:FimV/HubP family polar landmark protein [Rhodanobacter ginsengisoli]|uniref:FimV/HubP family polar landmark protein n=1 Tax=Rhodanobacter ginsengisoli TaxID=418646 RepID=A0ABW0QLA6_9GAMM
MNRSLKLSMLMALALGSSQVMALDLGQVQVKSALGQPLLAEIPLRPANPAELQNLTVQLASSEEFARAGIVGGRTTIPLHFSVANTAGGHKVIRITSSVAVDDPYLDLLIEVNGAAGKSVREFAILLDPPGAQAAAPAAVAAAPRPVKPSRTMPAKAPAAPAPVAAAPRAAATGVSNGQYGPVERGQTLSGIAHSTAPAGVDVQQMMLALKQANPDAFYQDNINALKSGAVLRVPTSAEAQAMTIAAAVAEVRRQNSDWRAGTPGKPTVVAAAATRASASSAPSGSAGRTEDRLALVPAKNGGAGSNATGKGDKSADSIRQDLLRAKESVASLQQQSADLKTRLKDLNDINSKNEHLLSLKDNEIAELQRKLAAARKASGMPAEAVKAANTAAVTTPPESSLETAVATAGTSAGAAGPVAAGSAPRTATSPLATAASAPMSSASAAVAAAVAPAPPAKPVSKPAAKPAIVPMVEQPWYMQTWAWAAGAGALLLLIVLAMLGRRKQAGTASKSSSSLADRFGAAAPADSDILDGEDLDQEELLDQLAEHPDDIGLHLELVTLYYSRRDVEHFEAAAEAMHAHITDPEQDEWQDVLHMGEDLVPGHPLFDHHPERPADEQSGARPGFDIDDYADENDAPTVVSSMPPLPPTGPKKVSEYNFNFDLTTPPVASPTASDDATVVAPLVADTQTTDEAASSWQFDESADTHQATDLGHDVTEFSDDPIDTKLDLARAYVDMGDTDGARAMLGEVIKEGSQMQRDTAKRLLESLS